MGRSVRVLVGAAVFLAAVSAIHVRYARRGFGGGPVESREAAARGEELVVGHLPVT